ncbi:hypothetical protein ACEQ8H_003253 [Pleosporales sp. CAS-2024a]
MHIKNPQSALLSNHEVLLHLRKEEAEYTGTDGTGRKRSQPSGLSHMLRDGLTYLQTPDYTTNTLATTHSSRPMTLYKGPHSLFRALAPTYRLNKAEYLQLYNLRPSTQVTLELVVEEQVFDEEEADIPDGVEDMDMEKVKDKLLGAKKGKRKGGRKKT